MKYEFVKYEKYKIDRGWFFGFFIRFSENVGIMTREDFDQHSFFNFYGAFTEYVQEFLISVSSESPQTFIYPLDFTSKLCKIVHSTFMIIEHLGRNDAQQVL